MVPQATCPPARQCWLRAWERAKAERLIPYRNQDGSWVVKAYTVSPVGPGWSDLACTCAGGRYAACKHRAVVAKAIAAGVRPVRGTAKADALGAMARRLADDLNGGYGATAETVASARAALVARARRTGIDPLAEAFA